MLGKAFMPRTRGFPVDGALQLWSHCLGLAPMFLVLLTGGPQILTLTSLVLLVSPGHLYISLANSPTLIRPAAVHRILVLKMPNPGLTLYVPVTSLPSSVTFWA